MERHQRTFAGFLRVLYVVTRSMHRRKVEKHRYTVSSLQYEAGTAFDKHVADLAPVRTRWLGCICEIL
jgi:hypothetical protein